MEEAVCEAVDELSVLYGKSGSFGQGAGVATNAADSAVAKLVAEVWPPGMAKNRAPTESVCAVFPGELDLLGPEQVAPKDHVLESSETAPKGHVFESAEMAPKDHVLVSAEMALKGHMLEFFGDGTERSRGGVFGDGAEGHVLELAFLIGPEQVA